MSVSMDNLTIGSTYDRPFLAKKWGYQSYHAISRGIVTPANDNKIILFITRIKQKSETQYRDYFIDEGILHMEGEEHHQNDMRLVNAHKNEEEIYLFYREKHHTPFIYFGEVYLAYYKLYDDKPSEFILCTSKISKLSLNSLLVEQTKYGIQDNNLYQMQKVKRN